MSVANIENIIAQVNQLPAAERAKLIEELNREEKTEYMVPEGRIISTNAPFIDRTRETEWLAKHRQEYAGRWVALMGDQLIASGTVAKEVSAKAKELGYPRAILIFVEPPGLPFVNV